MSAVKNLEALINIENNLKAQYETEIKGYQTQIATLTQTQETLQATLEEQKKSIAELSAVSVDSKRLEQTLREANNRAEKLQAELDTQKNRAKTLQKDLNDARLQVKTLEQYDAEKLKKNLVATKQTLAEQRDANALLTKTANKTKAENAELQASLKTLQDELDALKKNDEPETVIEEAKSEAA